MYHADEVAGGQLVFNYLDPDILVSEELSLLNSPVTKKNTKQNLGTGIIPSECEETANLLLFMATIFDSVNGSYKKNKYAKPHLFAKPILGPATPNTIYNKT